MLLNSHADISQQPNTTAEVVCSREYRGGILTSPSSPRVWSHKKAKHPQSSACHICRVLVWLEWGIWNPALSHNLGTSRSSLAGASFCLTQSPKAFPGFVESWPLSLFCSQPGRSDGGWKNLYSFLLKQKSIGQPRTSYQSKLCIKANTSPATRYSPRKSSTTLGPGLGTLLWAPGGGTQLLQCQGKQTQLCLPKPSHKLNPISRYLREGSSQHCLQEHKQTMAASILCGLHLAKIALQGLGRVHRKSTQPSKRQIYNRAG